MMNLKSLLTTKAPIVAIPVEGHAPACIDGKRLRAWAKGVTVVSVRIVESDHIIRETGDDKKSANYGKTLPVGTRLLEVVGQAGHIRTRASFLIIARGAAIKTLGAWSDKERERLAKKLVSATITPTARKALKLSQAAEEWADIPVEIAQFPLLSFAVVRKGDGAYQVKEALSGQPCGWGTSVERAILAARSKAAKLSPELIGIITAKCLAPEPAAAA
jgi:hypothetical protein